MWVSHYNVSSKDLLVGDLFISFTITNGHEGELLVVNNPHMCDGAVDKDDVPRGCTVVKRIKLTGDQCSMYGYREEQQLFVGARWMDIILPDCPLVPLTPPDQVDTPDTNQKMAIPDVTPEISYVDIPVTIHRPLPVGTVSFRTLAELVKRRALVNSRIVRGGFVVFEAYPSDDIEIGTIWLLIRVAQADPVLKDHLVNGERMRLEKYLSGVRLFDGRNKAVTVSLMKVASKHPIFKKARNWISELERAGDATWADITRVIASQHAHGVKKMIEDAQLTQLDEKDTKTIADLASHIRKIFTEVETVVS